MATVTVAPDARLHVDQGAQLFGEAHYTEALTEYETAIRIAPSYARAYAGRGWTEGALGKRDDALRDLNRAIELDPRDELALVYRGAILEMLGDHERAIGDYSSAIEIDPSFIAGLNHRGLAEYGLGRYDEAINDFTKSLGIQPDSTVRYDRALAYEQAGRRADAVADLTTIISSGGDASLISRAESEIQRLNEEPAPQPGT